MIVATSENIAGYKTVQTLGQCFGVVVRSRGARRQYRGRAALDRRRRDPRVHAAARGSPRRHAVDRLVQNATEMGADAIVMMRFDSAEIGQTMSEIVAYGTAVRVERVHD